MDLLKLNPIADVFRMLEEKVPTACLYYWGKKAYGIRPRIVPKLAKGKRTLSMARTRKGVEEEIARWVGERLDEGVVITGKVMRKRAEKLAREAGKQRFRAGHKWLDQFCEEHHLQHKSCSLVVVSRLENAAAPVPEKMEAEKTEAKKE